MRQGRPPLIIPPPLQPGDAVGIASPAGPSAPSLLRQGMALLKAWGYRPIVGRQSRRRKGYLAGSDRERAAELNDLFTDPEIKAVLCARGGYGTMRILDALDYEGIQRHPKIVMGFSDITALLCALHRHARLVTFHGPMVTGLPTLPVSVQNRVQAVLKGDFSLRIPLPKGSKVPSGKVAGRLIGGNLTLLSHLIGTPFEPPWEGAILFLEDCGEAPYRLDRLFQHLRLRGIWEMVSAVLLGSFTGPGGKGLPVSLIRSFFSDIPTPVWTGFPIGHGRRNLPVPFGVQALLNGNQGLLQVDSQP